MQRVNRQVPISYAVIQAKDDMAISDSGLDPLFKIWAKQAEDAIGSYCQFERKIYVIDTHHCSGELPCEAVAVMGVMMGDHGCNCGTLFTKGYGLYSGLLGNVNTLNGFMVIAPSADPCLSPVKWTLQGNKIVFVGDLHDQKVTIETLRYRCDEEGWMLINENHIRAIAAYLEYKFMRRNNHIKAAGVYDRGTIEMQARLWARLCRNARAEDTEPSDSEWSEIMTLWNDPFSGIQNAIWNTTNGYYKSLGGSMTYPW